MSEASAEWHWQTQKKGRAWVHGILIARRHEARMRFKGSRPEEWAAVMNFFEGIVTT